MVNPGGDGLVVAAAAGLARVDGRRPVRVTAVLLIWTLRSLGPNLTDTVVTRQAHTLVTRGPYRWVRHPFYGCMALFTFRSR